MKILRFLDEHLEEIVLVLLLIVIACSTGIQVVMRYIFNNSLSWTEEVSRYSLVASGFFSIGYCIRKNVALRIDLVVNLLPRAARILLSLLCSLFLIWLFSRYLLGSFPVRAKMAATNAMTPALDIPLLYIYTLPVIGFALGILRLIQSLVRDLQSLVTQETPGEGGEELTS